MDQSIAVLQLPLLEDPIYHICSFLFYTISQIRERNKEKYKPVLQQISCIRISCSTSRSLIRGLLMYHNRIYYENKKLDINTCGECGHYRKYVIKHPVSCQCYFVPIV